MEIEFRRPVMRKKNYKGRCEKRIIPKCDSIFKSYDPIQTSYVDKLISNENIVKIHANMELDGDACANYTSDFICELQNGDIIVRECVHRSHLTKPLTMKLLEQSFVYWKKHGVKDWGIVVDAHAL